VTKKGIVPQASRRIGVIWAALSTIALMLIVVAVPVGLAVVGGLPFSHIDPGRVTGAFSPHHAYDPRLITHWLVRGSLLLAWISWAWMTVCVVLEVRSWMTGHSPTRLPASSTMQSLAACLVGTALALAAMGELDSLPRTGGSAGPPVESLATSIRVIDEPPLLHQTRMEGESVLTASISTGRSVEPDPDRATEPRGQPSVRVGIGMLDGDRPPVRIPIVESPTAAGLRSPVAPPPYGSTDAVDELGESADPGVPDGRAFDDHRSTECSHVVTSRETLWSIATDRLGSALLWRELARLNYGIPQRDGGALSEDHWIRPGWTLILPEALARQGAPSGARSPRQHPSGPDIDRSATHHPLSDGLPLLTLAIPTSVAGTDQTPVGDSAGAPISGGSTTGWADPGERNGGHPIPPNQRLPLSPVGSGVVGAGVVGLLDRMRRVQQRHRKGGTYIKLPAWPQSLFEQRLRIGDGREITEAVDGALRLFAQECSDSELTTPVVNGVTVRSEAVELAIDHADAIVGPSSQFTMRSDGCSVLVDRRALPASGSTRRTKAMIPPAPLLVTVGHGPDGLVLVNLESLGTLIVSGDPKGCEGVVRALALELATSFWAGHFDLVLVGFGAELERFERVEAVTDVPQILDALCRRRISAAGQLQSSGHRSFSRARSVEDSDRWDPLVVICGPGVAHDDVTDLLELVPDPRLGIAIVAAGEMSEAVHVLRLSGPQKASSLELLGSVVFPQLIEADELVGVTSLVDTATSHQSMLLSEEPYLNLPIPMPVAIPDAGALDAIPDAAALDGSPGRPGRPAWSGMSKRSFAPPEMKPTGLPGGDREIEVAVLGQIEIRGAARDFTRAWAKELVVYLAMHPNGASNEAWATALWPDRLMAPSSLHSTASVARRSLGRARNGLDHLPHSHGRLALADTAGTDWDRFVALADADDIRSWRSALELVRGRPFEGLRSSDWPILEGIGPAIESAVVDLSGRLAGAYLSVRDPRGAEWSARKGLLASPYDERLYRMLMRAADLGGNPAGVEAVMSELVRLVADDIEPLDSVHPSTMDLYRSLTRRRAMTNRPR
jgi:DNA-binding SARP family transcriptional activator